MIKEEFGFGNSVEEATKQALGKLNPGNADYKIEIIEDYKPKVLGVFGGHQAQVKAFYECPDEPKKAPKAEKKATVKATTDKKPAKKAKAEEAPKASLNYIPLSEVAENSPAKKAAEYLSEVLTKLGVTDLDVKVADIENGSQIHIGGNNLGVVIGRRGETLDALQYLASFAANAGENSGYYRIVLDTGNYREKREETLKSLARRVSAQAIKMHRARSLEPMNPYERRIIHTEVQDIDGVSSHSVGDGVRRHVVICPDGVNPRTASSRDNFHGDRRFDRRQQRPSNRVEAPVREPHSDTEGDSPLYGRIG